MRQPEEIYLDIANLIVDAIEDEWKNAVLYIEFFGDSIELEERYESDHLAFKDFKVHHSILNLLKELDSIINPRNTKPWNRAKFYLEPDGEFEMEFAWDQKLADEIDRLSKED